jgi:hypothetical protein
LTPLLPSFENRAQGEINTIKAFTVIEYAVLTAGAAVLLAILFSKVVGEGRPISAILLPRELKLSTSHPAESDRLLTLKLAHFSCEFDRMLPEDSVQVSPRALLYKFLHCYVPGTKTILPKRPGELVFSEDPISIEIGEKEIELPLSLFQGTGK